MVICDVTWLGDCWLFKMTALRSRCATTTTENQSGWKLTIKENVRQTLVYRRLFKTHLLESVGYSIPVFFSVTNLSSFQLGPLSARKLGYSLTTQTLRLPALQRKTAVP